MVSPGAIEVLIMALRTLAASGTMRLAAKSVTISCASCKFSIVVFKRYRDTPWSVEGVGKSLMARSVPD